MYILLCFGLALAAGSGLTFGYYTANILTSYIVVKVQSYNIRRSIKKAKKEEELLIKKCVKCKSAPRPDNGIYCKSCRFPGL